MQVDPTRCMENSEPVEQTVSCFCDIALNDMGIHASKYGLFGVGVNRRQVAYYGGRPVIYLPFLRDAGAGVNNYFCTEGLNAYHDLRDHITRDHGASSRTRGIGQRANDALQAADNARSFILRGVLAFTKRFDVDLINEDAQNFYMEREWRMFGHLPLHNSLVEIVAPSQHHEELKAEFPHLAHYKFESIP